MSKCPNCGTAMSCGCQKRVAANGKVGCTKCISSIKTTTPPAPKNVSATIISNFES